MAIPVEKFKRAIWAGLKITVPDAAIGTAKTAPLVAVVAVLKNSINPAVAVALTIANPYKFPAELLIFAAVA